MMVGGFDANLGEALVIRYSATGSPDKIWGHRYFPDYGDVVGLAMSGSSVVVGMRGGAVGRLTPNGALDQTFGVGGYVETSGRVGLPSDIIALGANAKAIYALGENGPGDAVLFRIALDGKSYVSRPLCIGAKDFSS